MNFTASIFGVSLALSSYSAMGADWPPTLDSNPEVQPPKWDLQLGMPVKVNPDSSIKIYGIDMFGNENSSAVEVLHDHGHRVICYVNVGSWENWQDDKDDFPPSILGATYSGLPDDRWLDIRDVNPQKSQTGAALATILEARFDRALSMGCDAVEPDNMDGYDTTAHESSGFPLTYEDQIYFNLWVADAVHDRGMLVGLKNDINQAHDPRIFNAFDFVVSEHCFQYEECDYFSDFLAANKPVFDAEDTLAPSEFCPEAKASRISAIKKSTWFDATRSDCSAYYTAPPAGNLAPTAAFAVACAGLECTFTDQSSDSDGTISSWSWDFGDGNSSTEQSPSHPYADAGTYTVSLTVTDDDGATDTVSQGVTVGALTSTTYHPQAINVSAGSYDWGTLASFTNQDDDTYDIASAQAANGGATDWEASATVSSAVQGVGRLTVRYEGQYSIHSVSQELYLYNYETGGWELFDTRQVGQGNDLVVLAEITTNPQRYVSSSGEMRARVRGFHAMTQDFYVWANYLAWEVEGAGN